MEECRTPAQGLKAIPSQAESVGGEVTRTLEVDGQSGSQQPPKRHKRAPALQIEDPADDVEVIAGYLKRYLPVDGYDILAVPARAKSRMYDFGRKVQTMVDGEKKVGFACLATDFCRERSAGGAFISIGVGSSTNATDHLRRKHGCGKSEKSTLAEGTVVSRERRVFQARQSELYKTNKMRFLGLYWVRTNVIDQFAPLSSGESFDQQVLWSLTCHPEFPVTGLHRKAVKHKVIELYDATTRVVKERLREHVGSNCVSHVSFDLWADKGSTLKYRGIRLTEVTPDWELESRLLAVRPFNPKPEILNNNHLSGVLETYLKSVLEEFNLDISNVSSSTTDGEVKRLGKELLPGQWEWCICHMLNCAVVEATGMHINPYKCKNQTARNLIATIKKTVEYIRKSPKTEGNFLAEQSELYSGFTRTKLKNAVPHRWSYLADVLGFVILNSEAIGATFAREGNKCPLAEWDNEIRELYSLVKPVAEIIANAQGTHVPTAPDIVLQLCALKMTTLNTTAPLKIRRPERSLAMGASAAAEPSTPVMRAHTDLTEAARETRALFCRAIDWRWWDKRYGSLSGRDTDHQFDMQMMMHPATASLAHVDILCDDKERAAGIKEAITERVIKLAVELAEKEKEMEDLASNGKRCAPSGTGGDNETGRRGGMGADGSGGGGSSWSRDRRRYSDPSVVRGSRSGNDGRAGGSARGRGGRRVGPGVSEEEGNAGSGGAVSVRLSLGGKRDKAMLSAYTDLGLVRVAETRNTVPIVKTHEETVREELSDFLRIENCSLDRVPLRHTLVFWKAHAGCFPYMARVARVVLGAPASAAVIERDFSAAGRMMTSCKRSTDTAWVELILFLHGNKELIPDNVPALTEEQALGAIPGRLRNPASDLQHLDGLFHTILDCGNGEDEHVLDTLQIMKHETGL